MKKKIYKSDYIQGEKRIIKVLNYDNYGLRELYNLKEITELSRSIKLYTFEIINDEIYLYMEYGGKNLSTIGYADVESIKKIFTEILCGVEELHSIGMAHLDIKLQNILLKKGKIKLIDFEFSTKEKTACGCQGTCFYMAPEIVRKTRYDPKKADIWALGILLYRLVFGKFPIGNDHTKKQDVYTSIKLFRKLELPQYTDPQIMMWLQHTLVVDPNERACITDLFKCTTL